MFDLRDKVNVLRPWKVYKTLSLLFTNGIIDGLRPLESSRDFERQIT
jgi:hypothetical protein